MSEYCSAHGIALPRFEIYYIALKQNHKSLKKRDAADLSCYHAHPDPVYCNPTLLVNTVRPCLVLLAEVARAYRPRIINWENRHTGFFGMWNHVAHFDTVHTNIPDGFPMVRPTLQ